MYLQKSILSFKYIMDLITDTTDEKSNHSSVTETESFQKGGAVNLFTLMRGLIFRSRMLQRQIGGQDKYELKEEDRIEESETSLVGGINYNSDSVSVFSPSDGDNE
jgi:hypothetical protein